MAINFPTSLDNFTNHTDGTTVLTAAILNEIREAVNALEAKLGINGSGVTSSHDYKIAQLESGLITASGVTVFDTTMTAANTWQDLNLSAQVGTKAAWVFLEWVNTGGDIIYAKPKGYGGTPPNTTHLANSNCAFLGLADTLANNYVYTMLSTDGSGVIQIAANTNSSTHTIKLVSYFN